MERKGAKTTRIVEFLSRNQEKPLKVSEISQKSQVKFRTTSEVLRKLKRKSKYLTSDNRGTYTCVNSICFLEDLKRKDIEIANANIMTEGRFDIGKFRETKNQFFEQMKELMEYVNDLENEFVEMTEEMRDLHRSMNHWAEIAKQRPTLSLKSGSLGD